MFERNHFSKHVLKGLELCRAGDMICVEWCDASTGKSSANGGVVDVPAKSWGIYVGLFGAKTRHIVMVNNSFQYADGNYDLDYTAVPLSWVGEVSVVLKAYLPGPEAADLVTSFLAKDRKAFTNSSRLNHRGTCQRRMILHARRH